MGAELLPGNATRWEAVIADLLDTTASVAPAIAAIRGTKLLNPPPSFLPFLIYEYGLGELTPYVPNLYDLIAEGIDWQRVRGTSAAMALGLSWLGYTARIEEEDTQRRFWNLFQLELDRVRDTRADLDRIAGIGRLSAPLRSKFWRGYSGYDIRPLTLSRSHWSEAHFGEYSGRCLVPDGPLWSFGRTYALIYTPTQEDLVLAGVWVERYDFSIENFGLPDWFLEQPLAQFEDELPNDTDIGWDDITWIGTESSWASLSAQARLEAMASGLVAKPMWFTFFDADGDVIGHRRVRAQAPVLPVADGPYEVAGVRYEPGTGASSIYLECLTGFGDGDGATAASFGLTLDAALTDPLRPGMAWLPPAGLSGATTVATQPIDIVFAESIRERIKLLLRF